MTDGERDAFLAEPHIAVLAIPRGDRPPHATPVWYHHQPGGNVTFFTGTQGGKSRKAQLIEEAGVVSLCVQQETFPYKYVTVEGTIVQIDRSPSAEQALAIVRRYLPEELTLDRETVEAVAEGRRTPQVRELLRRRIVLDMPERYY